MTNFKHKFPIQIRFKDVDKMGHVNNANHLTYIELARLKYFEEIVKMEDGLNKEVGLILARIEIDYKQPLFLADQIFVYTRCSKIGTKSVELEWQIVRDKSGAVEIVAKGIAVIVYFNYEHNLTVAVPELHRKMITEYEGGPFK